MFCKHLCLVVEWSVLRYLRAGRLSDAMSASRLWRVINPQHFKFITRHSARVVDNYLNIYQIHASPFYTHLVVHSVGDVHRRWICVVECVMLVAMRCLHRVCRCWIVHFHSAYFSLCGNYVIFTAINLQIVWRWSLLSIEGIYYFMYFAFVIVDFALHIFASS